MLCLPGLPDSELTPMLRPLISRPKNDGYGVNIPHDEVVWPSPDHVPIFFKQVTREYVLTSTGGMACGPKPRYAGEDRPRILRQGMERRQPVESDGGSQEEDIKDQ
jgi:hypothetical protein